MVSGFWFRISGFHVLRKREMILSISAASGRFRCDVPDAEFAVSHFGHWGSGFGFRVSEEARNGHLDGGRHCLVQTRLSCFMLWGVEFGVWGLGGGNLLWDTRSLVEGFGFRANSEFPVLGSGFRISGLGIQVSGSESRVSLFVFGF